MAILSKGRKPDNFEPYNSVKLCFTNSETFVSILLNVNLSLNKNSIDSGNFSVRGYLPLIRKDSIARMHGLAVYVKEGLPFTRHLSLETLRILTYVFD